MSSVFPPTPDGRKGVPLYSGVFRYFLAALSGVARVSLAGSRQHHGSDELFHDRSKSADEADAMLRHLAESEFGDGRDTDGELHIDKFAWRALSIAQKYHERRGAAIAPAARNVPRYGELVPHEIAMAALRDKVMADDDAPDQNPVSPIGAQSGTSINQLGDDAE